MRRVHLLVIAFAVICAAGGCGDEGMPFGSGASSASPDVLMAATTGNGAPSGPHYTLNIIGVPKNKTASMDDNSGHRIFVPLFGSTKILLTEGDFAVLDANGTLGSAAFQLPNPDPDGDGETAYSVFVRALGKPGGRAVMTPTAIDPLTGEEFASTLQLVIVRDKGKSTFTNESKTLLFIWADINGDGVIDRVPLFDSRLQDFAWNFDNTGLKRAQLRFYEVPTDVTE